MNVAVKDFRHTLAHKPLPIDYYAIVDTVFGKEIDHRLPQPNIKKATLKQALQSLKHRGLTPSQIEEIEICLRNAISENAPENFGRLDFTKGCFLGALLDRQEINEDLAKLIKESFIDNLARAMRFKPENIEQEYYGADLDFRISPYWLTKPLSLD